MEPECRIERGFSTKDPLKWLAWQDEEWSMSYTFNCWCGRSRPIEPDGRGIVDYKHDAVDCGASGVFELDGYKTLRETKAETKARRIKEEQEKEAGTFREVVRVPFLRPGAETELLHLPPREQSPGQDEPDTEGTDLQRQCEGEHGDQPEHVPQRRRRLRDFLGPLE